MESEYETRKHELIDGIEWTWVKSEEGLWGGPPRDWFEGYLPKIQQLCKRRDLAIQAGGAMGMYPRLLSELFQYVYTFEPEARSFFALAANCKSENIFKFNAALGFHPGWVHMGYVDDNNMGTSRVHDDGPIPLMTIDQFNFPKCDLIMLDAEGDDECVLEGASETLRIFKPVVFVEHNSKHVGSLMQDLGYRCEKLKVEGVVYIPEDNNDRNT